MIIIIFYKSQNQARLKLFIVVLKSELNSATQLNNLLDIKLGESQLFIEIS